jgi:basic membrane lipoprotein Med (substrate-binding protein (PBP1-ABC) superfamily)
MDVTGGNGTYITLLSRLLSGETKNQKGEVIPLGNKIGQTSGASLIGQAIRYKLAPNASLIVDSLTGANAIGEQKTIPQSIIDRFKPMFINSLVELIQSDTKGKILFGLGALFGGGVNTYERNKPLVKKEVKDEIKKPQKLFKKSPLVPKKKLY